MKVSERKYFLSPENKQREDPSSYRRRGAGNHNCRGVKSQLLLKPVFPKMPPCGRNAKETSQ